MMTGASVGVAYWLEMAGKIYLGHMPKAKVLAVLWEPWFFPTLQLMRLECPQ